MGAAAEELKRDRATFPLCCEASLLYAGPVLPVWAALHSNAATGSGFGHRFTRGRAQCGMSSARGPCLHANGCRNQLNIFVLSESLNPKKIQTMPVSAPLIILCTVVSEQGGGGGGEMKSSETEVFRSSTHLKPDVTMSITMS